MRGSPPLSVCVSATRSPPTSSPKPSAVYAPSAEGCRQPSGVTVMPRILNGSHSAPCTWTFAWTVIEPCSGSFTENLTVRGPPVGHVCVVKLELTPLRSVLVPSPQVHFPFGNVTEFSPGAPGMSAVNSTSCLGSGSSSKRITGLRPFHVSLGALGPPPTCALSPTDTSAPLVSTALPCTL